MDISQYVNKDKLVNQKDLQSTFRQGLGALIWVHQSRPDVGFLITKIATDLVTACLTVDKALSLARLYNKTVKFLKNHPVEIHYVFPPGMGQIKSAKSLTHFRIICFTDAGFATLHDEHSIESNVTIFGKVLYRDGVIHCHGFLLDHRCAKIQRVCRSSLSAECHAAVTAGDYSLWYQILLIELLTHRYQIRKLCPPTNCPMLNPFETGPTDSELKIERLFVIHQEFDPTVIWSNEDSQTNRNFCKSCKIGVALFTSEKAKCENPTIAESVSEDESPELFKPILLTDCCSMFSSILRMQPNAQERCSRIILAHLRDLQSLLSISFIDATVNLGDVQTKHGGNNTILHKFMTTGRFEISFVGRKARDSARKNEMS